MKINASGGVSIINKTKGKLPRLPFVNAKNAVLGEKYELSVAFVGNKESQNLNKKYRSKNKPANILSFPLSKKEGEIIICPNQAKKDARNFNLTYAKFIPFLFIHGLHHLKGLKHSSRMDKKEAVVRKKFGLD